MPDSVRTDMKQESNMLIKYGEFIVTWKGYAFRQEADNADNRRHKSLPCLYPPIDVHIFHYWTNSVIQSSLFFLSDTEHLWYKTHTAVLSGIWLYSIAVALIILSSSPLIYRIHAVLILSFMLQMAVTDALTGLLPGTFTGVFNRWNIITNHNWYMVAPCNEIVSAAIVLFCLHKLVNRHRLNIGTGDLWLIAGITAWSGLYNAIWSVLLGAGGFVLWHSTWCIKGHKEGPLGPWLCLGHVLCYWIIFINHYG